MCVELYFSKGTLAENGDLRINNLSNSRRLWKVCQNIGFPHLGMQVKLEDDESVVIQNSHRFHQRQMKQFVVLLEQPIPQEALDELQHIINASDAELDIVKSNVKSNDSPQHDKPRTHRMSKSRTRR